MGKSDGAIPEAWQRHAGRRVTITAKVRRPDGKMETMTRTFPGIGSPRRAMRMIARALAGGGVK